MRAWTTRLTDRTHRLTLTALMVCIAATPAVAQQIIGRGLAEPLAVADVTMMADELQLSIEQHRAFAALHDAYLRRADAWQDATYTDVFLARLEAAAIAFDPTSDAMDAATDNEISEYLRLQGFIRRQVTDLDATWFAEVRPILNDEQMLVLDGIEARRALERFDQFRSLERCATFELVDLSDLVSRIPNLDAATSRSMHSLITEVDRSLLPLCRDFVRAMEDASPAILRLVRQGDEGAQVSYDALPSDARAAIDRADVAVDAMHLRIERGARSIAATLDGMQRVAFDVDYAEARLDKLYGHSVKVTGTYHRPWSYVVAAQTLCRDDPDAVQGLVASSEQRLRTVLRTLDALLAEDAAFRRETNILLQPAKDPFAYEYIWSEEIVEWQQKLCDEADQTDAWQELLLERARAYELFWSELFEQVEALIDPELVTDDSSEELDVRWLVDRARRRMERIHEDGQNAGPDWPWMERSAQYPKRGRIETGFLLATDDNQKYFRPQPLDEFDRAQIIGLTDSDDAALDLLAAYDASWEQLLLTAIDPFTSLLEDGERFERDHSSYVAIHHSIDDRFHAMLATKASFHDAARTLFDALRDMTTDKDAQHMLSILEQSHRRCIDASIGPPSRIHDYTASDSMQIDLARGIRRMGFSDEIMERLTPILHAHDFDVQSEYETLAALREQRHQHRMHMFFMQLVENAGVDDDFPLDRERWASYEQLLNLHHQLTSTITRLAGKNNDCIDRVLEQIAEDTHQGFLWSVGEAMWPALIRRHRDVDDAFDAFIAANAHDRESLDAAIAYRAKHAALLAGLLPRLVKASQALSVQPSIFERPGAYHRYSLLIRTQLQARLAAYRFLDLAGR